ncbi:MAG: EAL domain-containing protein [Arenimonas sp.]
MNKSDAINYGLGSESFLGQFLDNALDAVVVANSDGVICGWNASAAKIFGWQPEEALGCPLAKIIPMHMRDAHAAGFTRYHDTRKSVILNQHLELEGLHRDGHLIPIELTVTALKSDGQAAFAAFIRDLTEQRATNARLDELAHQDTLTNVLNRRGLSRSLSSLVEQSQRGVTKNVCILIDCDDFKGVNGRLGHAGGDIVLKELAARVRKSLRPSDIFARIGGDEFFAILPDTRLAEGTLIAERLRLSVSSRSMAEIPVTISAAVFAAPASISSIDELLALAANKIVHSKRLGKDRVTSGDEEERMLSKALTAVLNCQLHAYQQPMVDLGTRQITSYEMLIRGPEGPFENPNDFFHAARSDGKGLVADLAALKTCLSASTILPLDRLIHVNIAPSTLLATPASSIIEMIPGSRSPQNYCIEMSEQEFIGDPSYLLKRVTGLKEAGFTFAIDGVGFGQNSFESLVILEPDIAKIDSSLVSGIDKSSAQRRTVERLIRALLALDIAAFAVGVETEGEARMLADMGCAIGQGRLFGSPTAVPEA